ncbi:MAG TPA: Imm10 family immunity protein, partial [Telluria sp.]
MNYELLANFASLEEDEEILVFAFSADEFEAGKYVMFQYPLRPEKQDSHPDLDALYIECDDQSKGCYRGVESIRQVDDHIEIDLTEKGRQRLEVHRVFITPMPWSPTISDGLA